MMHTRFVEISLAPSNLTVPLGQSPAEFQCIGQGTFLVWRIGKYLVSETQHQEYELCMGFKFVQTTSNGIKVNTLSIPAVLENNHTQVSCRAISGLSALESETVHITIVGKTITMLFYLDLPFLLIQRFRVVVTHIVGIVVWEKTLNALRRACKKVIKLVVRNMVNDLDILCDSTSVSVKCTFYCEDFKL